MQTVTADDRLAFAPPQQPGQMRSFVLAVIAHVLLLLLLTQGLQWNRETPTNAVEAELWSALPQQAAPKEVAPPPPPAPVPPAPPAPAVQPPPPAPDPQVQRDMDIALERERQKLEKTKRDLEKLRQAEVKREQQRKLEAQQKREDEVAKKKLEQQQKLEQQKQQLAEAKRKEDDKKRKQQEQESRDTKKLAQLREENLRRIQGLAGSGAPGSEGRAAQSSGPSAGWAARVQARVRPNISFSDDVPGNPEAVVEVRLAPDGTIVSKRLKKSSGQKSWDEAVLRALDKTETLPRDVDGRVPSGGDLVFRPKG